VTGFEWAVGVPGSIGGAVRMNAGGHGSDMAANLVQARIADLTRGTVSWRAAGDLDLAYRRSNLRPTDVVLAADLRCRPGDAETAAALVADIVRWRRVNQPGGQNAGSVFTNPPGDAAGRLVEAAGLKGRRLGTAEVSPKHANFIQADDGGSADDVKALMDLVRDVVAEHAGVVLHTEIRLIGFPGTYPLVMPTEDGRD
jgi:UDP-N-acetylmuramate dehydrogenase